MLRNADFPSEIGWRIDREDIGYTGISLGGIHGAMLAGIERRAPESDIVFVDDAGHFVGEERPEQTADAIAEFFERHPPG